MYKHLKLSELIAKVQNGDSEAVNEVVERFTPIIKKYGSRLGYEGAYSDLVIWIIAASKRYKPNSTWGKDELEKYLTIKKESL